MNYLKDSLSNIAISIGKIVEKISSQHSREDSSSSSSDEGLARGLKDVELTKDFEPYSSEEEKSANTDRIVKSPSNILEKMKQK